MDIRSARWQKNDRIRKHKFVTQDMLGKAPLYSTENVASDDKVIWAQWFNPYSNQIWHVAELGFSERNGQLTAFCYIEGMGYPEWGYVDVEELAAVTVAFGLPLERNKYCKPEPLANKLAVTA